jgi:hypothetical protein
MRTNPQLIGAHGAPYLLLESISRPLTSFA